MKRINSLVFFSNLLFSLVFIYSCNGYDKGHQIAYKFLNDIKNEKYDEAKSMVSASSFSLETEEFNIITMHNVLVQYKIPPQNTWQFEFDARKNETILIPIYEGKGINHEYINIILYLDCTGYVDNPIIDFRIVRRRK